MYFAWLLNNRNYGNWLTLGISTITHIKKFGRSSGIKSKNGYIAIKSECSACKQKKTFLYLRRRCGKVASLTWVRMWAKKRKRKIRFSNKERESGFSNICQPETFDCVKSTQAAWKCCQGIQGQQLQVLVAAVFISSHASKNEQPCQWIHSVQQTVESRDCFPNWGLKLCIWGLL